MFIQIKAFLFLIYLFIRTQNTFGEVNYISRSSFSCSGGYKTITVPANANYMYVDMTGASSGFGGTGGGTPGYGARVQSTLPVTPGTTLNIFVGCVGTSCPSPSMTATGFLPGGYNGGGSGYGVNGDPGGSGGGGASDIRIGGTSLSDRVVVAGGGGGYFCASGCGTQKGGDGGQYGLTGTVGSLCVGSGHSTGQGGGWTAGGAAGYDAGWNPASTSGSFGTGGNGGLQNSGGGGGGYYGGKVSVFSCFFYSLLLISIL
jgi:hypothetical protein